MQEGLTSCKETLWTNSLSPGILIPGQLRATEYLFPKYKVAEIALFEKSNPISRPVLFKPKGQLQCESFCQSHEEIFLHFSSWEPHRALKVKTTMCGHVPKSVVIRNVSLSSSSTVSNYSPKCLFMCSYRCMAPAAAAPSKQNLLFSI